MKAAFANPFIRAAISVFQKEINIKLTRQDLKKKASPVPSLPVSIIIGATGPIRGQVVYSMDLNFAEKVAVAMIPGKDESEVSGLINSAVSEIANIITGRASIELAGEDKTIEITPPAVFSGKDFTMDFLNTPTISLSFMSEIGILEINIALIEQG